MNTFRKILTLLNPSFNDEESPREGHIFFLGIGGIGMSALARYFKSLGIIVSGYDKTKTTLTNQLSAEGITVYYEDSIDLVDKEAQLVVYTPAIPKDHIGLDFYRKNNYTVVKRSDVLGAITSNSFNICVAGTHGKTTTSTMVAHILKYSGYGCNAFLGGISANYSSNFWSSNNNVCVVEADEYDRSFLKLSPDIAIISSMDADHLDIYGTSENMENAFIEFAAKLKPGGLLISKYGLAKNEQLAACNHLTYHLDDDHADVYAFNIQINNGGYRFDVMMKDSAGICRALKNVLLKMGGAHNIENIIAAIIVAHSVGIEDDKIITAVADFRGVKRRFEYIIPPSDKVESNHETIFIDDYAHHPEELKALLKGAKGLFSKKKCIVIFQPHLFSRTKDMADGFAAVLDMADEVILLPVYPARELPMKDVSSKMILDRMLSENKIMMSKEDILKHLTLAKNAHVEEGFEGTVLITAGAGDIDTLVDPIKNILMGRN